MGKSQRTKGATFERNMVNVAKAWLLDARRTAPNQTQDGDAEFADVRICGRRCECKNRQSIGVYLWNWLHGNDVLIIKRNGREPLAVVRYTDWLELIGGVKPTEDQNG